MVKIAIQLNDDRTIIGYASETTAEQQAKYDGWILVDSDPAFSVDDMYSWTVRELDNMLVHTTTMMTSDEESKNNITVLTIQNLNMSKDIKEAQSGITSLTQAQLEDAKDKADIKNGLTEITKQLAAVQLQMAASNTTEGK